MSDSTLHVHAAEKPEWSAGGDPELGALVLQELDRVLASRFFKSSLRNRQFLEYIVHRKLEGHADELKERMIGIEIFHRPPNYATGDDPVVRVQALDLRRRLERYYQAQTEHSPVQIELPVGSYAPQFRLLASEPEPIRQPEEPPKTPGVVVGKIATLRAGVIVLLLAAVYVAGAVSYAWRNARPRAQQPSITEQFWAPALASQQPALICLAKPVVYRPTLELYQRYSHVHPDSFQNEVERSNRLLPLAPDTRLTWSELMPYPDYGVALGDVEAAVAISATLGTLGKPTQVRIGNHYSFEDLHNSPSVVVGAFNNKWTMQITHGLHFEFIEETGAYEIRERVRGGRTWRAKYDSAQQVGRDFAIVARLLDSNTGQFTVVAAGLNGSGTQAAGDFVSHPDLLEKALRTLPEGWQKKNVEFVVETNVTDAVAGPAHVEAFYIW